jgi:hypothetical protein
MCYVLNQNSLTTGKYYVGFWLGPQKNMTIKYGYCCTTLHWYFPFHNCNWELLMQLIGLNEKSGTALTVQEKQETGLILLRK